MAVTKMEVPQRICRKDTLPTAAERAHAQEVVDACGEMDPTYMDPLAVQYIGQQKEKLRRFYEASSQPLTITMNYGAYLVDKNDTKTHARQNAKDIHQMGGSTMKQSFRQQGLPAKTITQQNSIRKDSSCTQVASNDAQSSMQSKKMDNKSTVPSSPPNEISCEPDAIIKQPQANKEPGAYDKLQRMINELQAQAKEGGYGRGKATWQKQTSQKQRNGFAVARQEMKAQEKLAKRHARKESREQRCKSPTKSSSGGWHRCLAQNPIDNLGDWSGNLAPPVLNWELRPAFRAGQSDVHIEAWLDRVEDEFTSECLDREISMSDYQRYMRTPEENRSELQFDPDYWSRSIVPAYWMPLKVGNQTPKLFWTDHIKSSEPRPVDDGDLDGVWPWWIEFPPHQSPLTQIYTHPTIRGIDPDETPAQRTARAQDRGSAAALKPIQGKSSRQRLTTRHKVRADIRHSYSPKKALMIRPASREDMMAISKIYNRYINFTTATADHEECTEEDMKLLWQACKTKNLPMLVACEPTRQLQVSKKYRGQEPILVPERIVGFTYASDFHIGGFSSKHTKELQVFTDSQELRKGIATCLVDKLIKSMIPRYEEMAACHAEIDQDRTGGEVTTLLVQLLWSSARADRLEWITTWLLQKFKFERCADLTAVAVKNDQALNLTTFRRSMT